MSNNPFEQHKQAIEGLIKKLPRKAVIIARKHFDESFSNSGFTDQSLKKWKPVRDHRKGSKGYKAKPLVKSGRLRASIRTKVDGNKGIVYTEVPYAAVHNDGSKVTVKSHSRRSRNGKKYSVKAHPRTTDKRQFMGSSKVLDNKIESYITSELTKIFNQ